MRKIKAEKLSVEEFLPYGFYADFLNPSGEKLGDPPLEFYRDTIQQDLGSATTVSFSAGVVCKRDMIIDASEYHATTGEALLPLDNDILVHVAPASLPSEGVPVDKIRVFRVPKGTMVIFRPGVWHQAPLTANDDPATVLCVLPERAYANDCEMLDIEKDSQLEVEI